MADGAERKAETFMSRTDKTRPFWIKVCDSTSNYKEVHNHASRVVWEDVPGETCPNGKQKRRSYLVPFTECDLPESPWPNNGEWHQCHWDYTREFSSSGDARCGCPICADSPDRKRRVRKERRIVKKSLRDWEADEWTTTRLFRKIW